MESTKCISNLRGLGFRKFNRVGKLLYFDVEGVLPHLRPGTVRFSAVPANWTPLRKHDILLPREANADAARAPYLYIELCHQLCGWTQVRQNTTTKDKEVRSTHAVVQSVSAYLMQLTASYMKDFVLRCYRL